MPTAVVRALVLLVASAGGAAAQPIAGYQFADRTNIDRFVAERWVASASPEVSPAGECDCMLVVSVEGRRLLTLGTPGVVSARGLTEPTGRDLDGDGASDLVIANWSGGAHCCYQTTVYSVGRDLRTLLDIDTGDCGPGEFADLDGDGTLEFVTCDTSWKDGYCAFAAAPFPTVILKYDAGRRQYRIATPRFERHLRPQFSSDLSEAERALQAGGPHDSGDDKCAALRPALDLMYAGQMARGVALLRRLYRGADRGALISDTEAKVRASPLWITR